MRNCELVQQLLRGWRRFQRELPLTTFNGPPMQLKQRSRSNWIKRADIVLLAAYIVQIHPRLCEHPRVVQLVKSARQESPNLAQRLSELPDDSWG
ncbi:hypothetical protein ACU4HD_47860 [Cupriavidus basilensis]